MTIGVPKEIKVGETRVSMTPGLCERMRAVGAAVIVEAGAGSRAGFSDDDYRRAGAKVADSAAAVWSAAGLILKVKEPLAAEYECIKAGQAIFTYLHLAANAELADVLVRKRVLAMAYENVRGPDGGLPLLKPMSQIAGRLAIQVGAHFLESQQGGSGVLLGGIPGTAPAHVVVVGAGACGASAIRVAIGMGARVTALDVDTRKLDALESEHANRVATVVSNPANLEAALAQADLLVSAVLVPAARAPVVATKRAVSRMRPGSVVVDVAIDQGGAVEGIRATSHDAPVYLEDSVLHYAVPNMPARVSRTSTLGLTDATGPYVELLARAGVEQALEQHPGLAQGVTTRDGAITCEAVARSLNGGASRRAPGTGAVAARN